MGNWPGGRSSTNPQDPGPYPDDVKKDMFWYLNGHIPAGGPARGRSRARCIAALDVDRRNARGPRDPGREAVPKYQAATPLPVPKHILGDKFTHEFLTSTGKLNLSYAGSART